MATNTTPAAKVTWDKPNAQGRVTLWGYEEDWQFAPVEDPPFRYGATAAGQAIHGESEYLQGIGCIRPRGYAYLTDMVMDASHWWGEIWYQYVTKVAITEAIPGALLPLPLAAGQTVIAERYTHEVLQDLPEQFTWVSSGTAQWRLSRPTVTAGGKTGRVKFLDYYDSAPNHFGVAVDERLHWRNMAACVIKQAQPDNTTKFPAFVAFHFMGDPLIPGAQRYSFWIPTAGCATQYPVLTMDDASRNSGFTKVAEWTEGAATENTGEPTVEQWRFEWVADGWYVRRSGITEPWIFRPDSGSLADAYKVDRYPMTMGRVMITVSGHAAMIWFGDIDYAQRSVTTIGGYRYVDEASFSQARVWHQHAWWPDDKWTVQTTEKVAPEYALAFRPQVAIMQNAVDGGNANRPAEVYVASCYAEAEQGDVDSSPVVLDKDNGYWVEAVSWDINYEGRGQTCEVTVNDRAGGSAWKGNEQFKAEVGWNKDDGSGSVAQKFFGYAAGIERTADEVKDSLGPSVRLTVADPIGARLEKKFMVNKAAAGGEDLPLWLYHILFDAGAPAAQLTSIYAMIGDGPVIPMGKPKGDLRFKFAASTCVIDAIDQVGESCNREWGFNCETGLYFLREKVETIAPTPDWTLDDDTATAVDLVWKLTHNSSPEEFRNVLLAMAEGDGEEWAALYEDPLSRATDTDASYIGDDWWEVSEETDDPEGAGKSTSRWLELLKQHSLISWEMNGRTDLGPGKFVKMQVTKLGVTTDAVYQIIGERGELSWGTDAPKFRQTFTARIWETS